MIILITIVLLYTVVDDTSTVVIFVNSCALLNRLYAHTRYSITPSTLPITPHSPRLQINSNQFDTKCVRQSKLVFVSEAVRCFALPHSVMPGQRRCQRHTEPGGSCRLSCVNDTPTLGCTSLAAPLPLGCEMVSPTLTSPS